MNFLRRLFMPFQYKVVFADYASIRFRLLDVGCGPLNVSRVKRIFPACSYYGVDISDPGVGMDGFFRIDLETDDLGKIPDDYFDLVIAAHVIEHLDNGLKLIEALCPKLRDKGRMYVETPSEKSLSLPSMKGCLNFYDDPGHKRLYRLDEIQGVLRGAGLEIIAAGLRRDFARIFAMPLFWVVDGLVGGRGFAGSFWDVLGFAHYVYARKGAHNDN